MPSEDGIRIGNRRNLVQGLLAQFLANLGKGLTITITELYTTGDLVA